MKDYANYDGVGLAKLVADKQVSPAELLEAAIERVERNNETLNAVVYKAYDEARKNTSTLPEGPFSGVPFLVKDLGCPVGGMPRTSGSKFQKDYVCPEDGELTKRYRAAGLNIFGKTNTPEHGITGVTESALLGPCRTPWNPDHASGGSSGGSAAAVAAGIVPMAHASDGLGSIRIPAACCGLFGMKTTRDRNPNWPEDRARAIGMSVDHVVTRSVRDSAHMLDATGYPEPNSPYAFPYKERRYAEEIERPVGQLKIAFSSVKPNGKPVSGDTAKAMVQTVKLLEDLGHIVEEKDIGIDYRRLFKAQGRVSAASAAASYAHNVEKFGREPREDELEQLTWGGIHAGQKLSGDVVMDGWQTLREMSREIVGFFTDYDVYLTPVLGTPPPPVGHINPVTVEPKELNRRQAEAFPFTPMFNFSGQPAMSVPLYWTDDGLPMGMQFAGRYADEATLFRLAIQLEEATKWAERKPPVWD